MTDSGRRMLDTLKRILGAGRGDADRDHAALLAAPPPRPVWQEDRLARFAAQLKKAAGSWERVPEPAAVPAAAAAYLEAQGLARELLLAPHPLAQSLPWSADWRLCAPPVRGSSCAAALAVAACGIAETGSVVFAAGTAHPTLLALLPDHLLVLLPLTELVDHMEDVWPRLLAQGALPRTVNFITGPSRTADIEQTIQLGAHGARRLHVIVIG